MNNRGNIMINLLFFLMAFAVLVMFISPLNTFIGYAQGNNNLNCAGYIDPQATATQNFSYNPNINTSSMSCLALSLYLPYLVIIFLIAGTTKLLYEKINILGPDTGADTGGVAYSG